MFFYLISSLKRRIILELQESFSRHPEYNKITGFIGNKYSFEERPQFGIVIKGSSANKVQLSAENFMGTVDSYVMLAYLDKPSHLLEWVREDTKCLEAHDGQMPTAPGVYYIHCTKAPTILGEEGEYYIDPLLTVTDEPLLRIVSGVESEAHLPHTPVEGTLRIWENHRILLVENTDYRVDYTTGKVSLLTRYYQNSVLTADYRYAGESIGPVPWKWNTSDWKTLPGVVLAFGKRGVAEDKMAVVVYSDRVATANAFGGRFDASFDLDVIATDPIQMEEIADHVTMVFWAEKRSLLSSEGIEVVDISMGGETEETYDETANLFFYNFSMGLQIQADWEIHIPLPFTISKAVAQTKSAEEETTYDRRGGKSSLTAVSAGGGLFISTSPILSGRNSFYEKIT